MPTKQNHLLHSIDELLASGGDARIACDLRGVNRYGCHSTPRPNVLAYGSSTASTISPAGFDAALRLHRRLEDAAVDEAAPVTYAREMDRVRGDLIALCDLDSLSGLEIAFGGSGTDLHVFASQLLRKPGCPLLVIMPEASETGSGMRAALEGHGVEVVAVASRFEGGAPRPKAVVDVEVEARVALAVSSGVHVLLVLTDVSKTGLITPSPACALALRQRFPAQVDVMVDACQFRLAKSTIRAYLENDFLLAMTGSKFVTGPAFCGALLIPPGMAERMRGRSLPSGVRSCAGDWPKGWSAARSMPTNRVNYGLLLRLEAAIEEMRAFQLLTEAEVPAFAEMFARAVQNRLTLDPAFEPVLSQEMDRRPFACDMGWDHVPTIFPFLVRKSGRRLARLRPPSPQSWGNMTESTQTFRIYEMMKDDQSAAHCLPKSMREIASRSCLVGQPVACGMRDGVPVSALRLNLDMRLIVDALSTNGRGCDTVIAEALTVLDKASVLAEYLLN